MMEGPMDFDTVTPLPATGDAERRVLDLARDRAVAFLQGLPSRPVSAALPAEALRALLPGELPDAPLADDRVIDALADFVEQGALASSSPRFFGWVIGGALPVGIAADWLTSTWDQNAAAYALSPAASVLEEICGTWLKSLLGIPSTASFAFVTGCQMAHTTALAAARHRLLADRSIDVETAGLSGAPPIRILTGSLRHESLIRAVRLLGVGTGAVQAVPCDSSGMIDIEKLPAVLEAEADTPTILCLQAGDLNTGAFDPFEPACWLAHRYRAWVHIDGAFGLWAAASPRFSHCLAGAPAADSWATDGHKWLNLPHDSGFVFVADARAHQAAFGQATSFALLAEGTRRQLDWNPEWSRRARVFAVYAVLRSLGRSGVAAMIERCCDIATALVSALGALPGASVVAMPIINQGLVRFWDDDALTDRVAEAVRQSGIAWFGTTSWQGRRAMRVSVCNWRTTLEDVPLTVKAVADAMALVRGAR
jgi:glutamate/tyrosine decarboxylase-like PLP-dependent enzyme